MQTVDKHKLSHYCQNWTLPTCLKVQIYLKFGVKCTILIITINVAYIICITLLCARGITVEPRYTNSHCNCNCNCNSTHPICMFDAGNWEYI